MFIKVGMYRYSLHNIKEVYISSDDILLYFPLSPNSNNELRMVEMENETGWVFGTKTCTVVVVLRHHSSFEKLKCWIEANTLLEL